MNSSENKLNNKIIHDKCKLSVRGTTTNATIYTNLTPLVQDPK